MRKFSQELMDEITTHEDNILYTYCSYCINNTYVSTINTRIGVRSTLVQGMQKQWRIQDGGKGHNPLS